MERFSISFTLGKASTAHGANVNHNNRKYLADNINPAETPHNISYKMQSVESAYQELFSEAIREYNERQKRPCRRIADYYSHIANGHREEPFYEAVVQVGDCRTVQPGTQRWYAARTLLNDYMTDFQQRNPNLFVFNAVMHLDEASPYVKFFYATDDKQAYVMQQLEQMGIPFRETENGFEAQECHIKTIRSIEKNYHGQPVSFREQLKEDIDRCMLSAKDFRDFLQKLSQRGYMIKTGKYIAAKPWNAERYIRFKSLGEHYTEASLRGLLDEKLAFEKKLAAKIEEAKTKQSPNVMVLLTARGYMDSFITYRLPVRKLWHDRPLTWVNDAELDKLSALNAAINNGETIETFRRRFHDLTEQEKAAERAIEHMIYMGERDTKKLADARAYLDEVKASQKDAAEKLEMIEKIMNGTYMQDMLDKFSERKRSEIVPNGYYNANTGVRRR